MNAEKILAYIDVLEKGSFEGWTDAERNGYMTCLTSIKAKVKEYMGYPLEDKIRLLTAERDQLRQQIIELQEEIIEAKQESQRILNEMFSNMIHTKCGDCNGTGRLHLPDGTSLPCDTCFEKGVMTVVRMLGKVKL